MDEVREKVVERLLEIMHEAASYETQIKAAELLVKMIKDEKWDAAA